MVDGPGLEAGASSVECEDDDGDEDEDKGEFARRDVGDCVVGDGSPGLADVEEDGANEGPYSCGESNRCWST